MKNANKKSLQLNHNFKYINRTHEIIVLDTNVFKWI